MRDPSHLSALLLFPLISSTPDSTAHWQRSDHPVTSGVHVEGLDPRIWCLHQSEDGDLWFGSNGVWLVMDVGAGKICRFDGTRLHELTPTERRW
ncbi:MAG: hypothetical protein AAGG01_07305 [Planctomycetota bacterium]